MLAVCCGEDESAACTVKLAVPVAVGVPVVGDAVRAISLDPNCGWTRGKADVVYVADAFKVIAKLNELLMLKG